MDKTKQERIEKLRKYLVMLASKHDFVPLEVIDAIKSRISLIKDGKV